MIQNALQIFASFQGLKKRVGWSISGEHLAKMSASIDKILKRAIWPVFIASNCGQIQDMQKHCSNLPGAISEGETREEALANIKEAIELVLEVLSEELTARSNVEVLKVELVDVC